MLGVHNDDDVGAGFRLEHVGDDQRPFRTIPLLTMTTCKKASEVCDRGHSI